MGGAAVSKIHPSVLIKALRSTAAARSSSEIFDGMLRMRRCVRYAP
jgi:hypothetical protein